MEKRADLGVVKIADINENNARENTMDYLNINEKFDNDLIFPSDELTKRNTQRGYKYHESVD